MNAAAEQRLDRVFRALANPTRRRLLALSAARACTVGELAAPFKMSLAAVSKHLYVLERAGLLKREVRGRYAACRLDPEPLQLADRWLEDYRTYWEGRLDALEALLAPPSTRKRGR